MMPDRLVDDPEGVSVLAVSVAEKTGIPAAHVEKDFWVTEVLRGIAEAATTRDIEIVFKGGTSLSKAFGLVERFSEDVDVLVVLSPQESAGERDRSPRRSSPVPLALLGWNPQEYPTQQRTASNAVHASCTERARMARPGSPRVFSSSSAHAAVGCQRHRCLSHR